jgi:hypothetical protein
VSIIEIRGNRVIILRAALALANLRCRISKRAIWCLFGTFDVFVGPVLLVPVQVSPKNTTLENQLFQLNPRRFVSVACSSVCSRYSFQRRAPRSLQKFVPSYSSLFFVLCSSNGCTSISYLPLSTTRCILRVLDAV